MIRYLLWHHPIAVCVVLFIIAMLAMRFIVAPALVEAGGLVGTLLFVGGCLVVGWLIDR